MRTQSSNLLAEILMIVVGINVALWFEDWFQQRENRATEIRYLQDLKVDLEADIEVLAKLVDWTARKSEKSEQLSRQVANFADLPADRLAAIIHFPSSYQFFTPSDFTYRSMQESGDFRLLTSEAIKRGILRLDRTHGAIAELQENYLRALDDAYLPLMMTHFDIATGQLTDASLLDKQLFRNFFPYIANDTAAMSQLYGKALADSRQLIALINDEISG